MGAGCFACVHGPGPTLAGDGAAGTKAEANREIGLAFSPIHASILT